MDAKRGCLWGIIQVGIVTAISGCFVCVALSLAAWQEEITLAQVWGRIAQPRPSDQTEIIQRTGQNVAVEPIVAFTAQLETPERLSMMTLTPSAVDKDHGVIQAPATPTLKTATSTLTPIPPVMTPSPMSTPSITPIPPTATASSTATPVPLPPSPTATAKPIIDPTLTRLLIPKLNLDQPIYTAPIVNDTWQISHLNQTVGHLARTANPGERGNIVLTAADQSGPFANLAQLDFGDAVMIHYQGQAFHYQIDYLATVLSTDIAVTYPTHNFKLTLLTHLQSGNADETRLVAVGFLVQDEE